MTLRPRRLLTLLAPLALAAVVSGCDDAVKWVPWFSHMSEQPSVETYQEEPLSPPEGTVAVDGRRTYGLLEADALLESPLDGTEEELARGAVLYRQFCYPCHGEAGAGDGPVVMPQQRRGIPFTPAMDLHTESARALSDGYLWGIITEGRGLMPAYQRIPPDERWYVVAYVRQLQGTGGEGAAGAGAPEGSPPEAVEGETP